MWDVVDIPALPLPPRGSRGGNVCPLWGPHSPLACCGTDTADSAACPCRPVPPCPALPHPHRNHFDVVVACEDDDGNDLDVPLVSIKFR